MFKIRLLFHIFLVIFLLVLTEVKEILTNFLLNMLVKQYIDINSLFLMGSPVLASKLDQMPILPLFKTQSIVNRRTSQQMWPIVRRLHLA